MRRHHRWNDTKTNYNADRWTETRLMSIAKTARNLIVNDMRSPKSGLPVPANKGKLNPRTGRGSYFFWVTRRSAPGEAPAAQRKRLLGSVDYEWQKRPYIIAIGTNVKYGRFLERGQGMDARPWLKNNVHKAIEQEMV